MSDLAWSCQSYRPRATIAVLAAQLHPHETLLQQARELQVSATFILTIAWSTSQLPIALGQVLVIGQSGPNRWCTDTPESLRGCPLISSRG